MTTPNNKSWEEKIGNLIKDFYTTFAGNKFEASYKKLKENNGQVEPYFIEDWIKENFSLLEQERKAEREMVLEECRQRVIDECIEKCSFFISRNLEMNPYDTAWNDAANAIVERLELLKEE